MQVKGEVHNLSVAYLFCQTYACWPVGLKLATSSLTPPVMFNKNLNLNINKLDIKGAICKDFMWKHSTLH